MSDDDCTRLARAAFGEGTDPSGTPWDELDPALLRERRTSLKWTRYPADVLPLFVAEMDFAVAPEIRRALIERVEASDTGYLEGPGPLAPAFAAFAKDRWGWEPPPAHVHLATDVATGIVEALRVFRPHGGRLVLSTPVYPGFFEMLQEVPFEVVEVPLVSAPGPAGPFPEPVVPFPEPTAPFPEPSIPFPEPAVPFPEPAVPFPEPVEGNGTSSRTLRQAQGTVENTQGTVREAQGAVEIAQSTVQQAQGTTRQAQGAALDLEAIRREFASDRGVDAFILCNPHNPHGLLFPEDQLSELARLAAEYDVFVLSDEIHAPLTRPGRAFTPFGPLAAEAGALSVTATSASKGWNLAGGKCSVLVAADDRANAVLRGLPPETTTRASILGLHANVAAFAEARDWLDRTIAQVEANEALFAALVAERLPGVTTTRPTTGYLSWLDLRGAGLGDDPHGRILREARVALNDGRAFGLGGAGHARLNLACAPATLIDAVDRIASILPGGTA